MLLNEIKEQVERWMQSKSDELKKQQEALKQETNTQIQNMEKVYRQHAAAEQETLRTERERMNRENDARVQHVEELQQSMVSTKKEIAEVLRQQKSVTDQERKTLKEREEAIDNQKREFNREMTQTKDEIQRVLKNKADASRINELEEDVDDIRRGQSASRLVPTILSIAAITLLILAAVVGFLIMRGKLAANQERMDAMQSQIDELSITPEPTPVPTPMPSPEPSEELEPMRDPAAEMMQYYLPAILEWSQSDSVLPLENAEILRSYCKDGVFVNIISDKDNAIKEDELYKQSGFSVTVPTAEPIAEPEEELKTDIAPEETAVPDENSTTDATESTAEPVEDLTPETTEETLDATQEPTDAPVQTEDPHCVVLETVRINGEYLCVFFVQQKEAHDVDYRVAVKTIDELLEGQIDRTDFTSAFTNGEYSTIVNDAWNENKIYPIPAEFVPEDLIKDVSDDSVTDRIWMYHYDSDRFVYVVHKTSWDENERDAYFKKLQDTVTGEDLLGIVVKSEDGEQVIVFFVEDGETWYQELKLHPVLPETESNG